MGTRLEDSWLKRLGLFALCLIALGISLAISAYHPVIPLTILLTWKLFLVGCVVELALRVGDKLFEAHIKATALAIEQGAPMPRMPPVEYFLRYSADLTVGLGGAFLVYQPNLIEKLILPTLVKYAPF